MLDINSQIIFLLTGWMPSINKENQEKPLTSNEWTVVGRKLHSKGLMPKDLQSKNQNYYINELQLDKDFSERIIKLLNRSGQFLFELEKYNTQGYELLTRADSLYPKILKKNMKGSSPSYFWYVGNNSILKNSFISLQFKHDSKNDYSFIEKDLFPEIKKNNFSIVLSFNDDLSLQIAEKAINNEIQVLGFPPVGLLKLTKQVKIRSLLKTKKLLLFSQSYPSIIKYYQYNGGLQKKSELSISEWNIVVGSLSDMHYKEFNNIPNSKIVIHSNVVNKKLDHYRSINSNKEIFQKEEPIEIIKKDKTLINDGTIYTIGHSNHSIEKFIELLELNNIEMIIDVRTVAKSSYTPHFNKIQLINSLKRKGIKYQDKGKTLGGRPDKQDLLIKFTKRKTSKKIIENGKEIIQDTSKYEMKIDENVIEQEDWYINSINQLIEYSKDKNIAIMCSEENPENCHRGYIISHTLIKQNVRVKHIRKSGNTDKGRRFHKPFQVRTESLEF